MASEIKRMPMVQFKPIPEWVVEAFKSDMDEEIEKGIVKTVRDAFFFTKGYFDRKDCVPKEAIMYIDELISARKIA